MRLAIRRRPPSLIPTSGDAALALNVYTVYLSTNADFWNFCVERLTPSGVEGASFAERGARALERQSLTNLDIPSARLRIDHHFHGFIITYESHWDFLFKTAVQFPRLLWWRDHLAQRFFNKRRLAREDRMKVLRLVMEQTVRDPEFKIGSTGLMTLLYSQRWIRHPDQDALQAYHQIVLESLRQSGDLAGENYLFKLAPQALATLSVWEEDNRRHSDNVRIQRRIAVLTGAIAAIALFQAWSTVWSELHPDPQAETSAVQMPVKGP